MNASRMMKYLVRLALCAAVAAAGVPAARAAEPEAQAILSSAVTQVGQPVLLTIRVTGSRDAGGHPEIVVDGLEISPVGRSSQFQMHNFDVTVMEELTYDILPLREGTFTIPSVAVEVGGKILRTRPVELVVGPGGRMPAAPRQGGSQQQAADAPLEGNSDLVYAELIVPKTTAYVGETIPIEIRLFFDSRLRYQIEGPPELEAEGLTMKAMPKPRQEQRKVNGQPYDVIIFNTVLTPIKAGKLTVGPVTTNASVQSPVSPSRRPQSPFDVFDSLFDDPFFGGGFRLMQTQRVRISSDPVELDIRDVPSEGRPATFDGAVGNFDLDVTLDSKQTSVGSPLAVQVVVSGRGDFDRVNPPVLSDSSGWRTYPPSSEFKQDDTLGMSGRKTFQILMIPDEVKRELPPIEFSYFDPATEEFRTLRSEPVPITVAPGSSLVQPPAAQGNKGSTTDGGEAAGQSPDDTANASALAEGGRDILHILGGSQHWVDTIAPFYRTRGFWLLQAGAFVVFVTAVGFAIWRSRLSDARRLAHLAAKRKLDDLRRKALAPSEDAAARLRAAVNFVRLATERIGGPPEPLVDAEAAIRARPKIDPATADGLRELFASHDELSYGRATSRGVPASLASTLQSLETYDEKVLK